MASTKRPVPEWSLKADSKSDLFGKLSEMDISLPSRRCGHTSQHVERRFMCCLLSTLNNNNRLAFPVDVSKSERPDFVITINGNPSFGVEVTEAIQEDFAQTMTLRAAQLPGSVMDPSLFRWSDPGRSLEEKKDIASRTALSGPMQAGDDPEKEFEFAQAIKDITCKKTSKLNEDTFQKFDENWLGIYEYLCIPMLDEKKAMVFTQSALEPYWRKSSFSNIFDRIFVQSNSRYIIEFSQSSFCLHRLCNLW